MYQQLNFQKILMSLYNIHDNHPYMYSRTVSLCEDNYTVILIFLLRYIYITSIIY